jgi:predicted HTH transcriptional regulator
MDLLDLLRRPEGKTLEFKRDLSSPRGVLRSLVAFARAAGAGRVRATLMARVRASPPAAAEW